ncbi:tRNA-dihydrouridine synthase [Candidatus Dependentiae bacterium]|nr:tRNA-dihydrouridine synthase [Candidatus Dependentiae bacterium]
MSFYDIDKNFEYNAKNAGKLDHEIPERIWPDKNLWYPFLDSKIASPLGIPACSITTGKKIEQITKLGFDVLTYKTVRSICVNAHPMPNISWIECKKQLKKIDEGDIFLSKYTVTDLTNVAIANSFGNACLNINWVLEDIAFAKSCMSNGQFLIVSVYGSVEQKARTFFDDFAYVAALVQEAGAQAVELNISCPNYCGKSLYKNYYDVYKLVKTVNRAVNLPIIIKVGVFDNYEQAKKVLYAAARAGARGICGINSMPRKVMNKDGKPTFGKRIKAGISGKPIFSLAQEFIIDTRTIIDQEKLSLILLAAGGVTCADDFDVFLDLGADVAMSAGGAIWNPYIAHKWHKKHSFVYSH